MAKLHFFCVYLYSLVVLWRLSVAGRRVRKLRVDYLRSHQSYSANKQVRLRISSLSGGYFFKSVSPPEMRPRASILSLLQFYLLRPPPLDLGQALSNAPERYAVLLYDLPKLSRGVTADLDDPAMSGSPDLESIAPTFRSLFPRDFYGVVPMVNTAAYEATCHRLLVAPLAKRAVALSDLADQQQDYLLRLAAKTTDIGGLVTRLPGGTALAPHGEGDAGASHDNAVVAVGAGEVPSSATSRPTSASAYGGGAAGASSVSRLEHVIAQRSRHGAAGAALESALQARAERGDLSLRIVWGSADFFPSLLVRAPAPLPPQEQQDLLDRKLSLSTHRPAHRADASRAGGAKDGERGNGAGGGGRANAIEEGASPGPTLPPDVTLPSPWFPRSRVPAPPAAGDAPGVARSQSGPGEGASASSFWGDSGPGPALHLRHQQHRGHQPGSADMDDDLLDEPTEESLMDDPSQTAPERSLGPSGGAVHGGKRNTAGKLSRLFGK